MGRQRFKDNTSDSFFGQFLYKQVVPPEHFLMQLQRIIPWERFSARLVQYYKGQARLGRVPYDPVVLLKMLLLSYLYNISERQVEDYCNFYLPAKCFLGLGVDERPPDHSTLSAFKGRLLQNGNLGVFEQLLSEIISIALEKGIKFGSLQIIDSTHTVAKVNVQKDKERQRKGQPPRDRHAAWGVKHSHKVRDEKGEEREVRKYFYGYKVHVSINAETGLITSVLHTAGNAYDGHQLPWLLEKDLAQKLPVQIVAADRGYDDSNNHILLQEKGIHSAIQLHDYRTRKKDENKAVWLALRQTEEYKLGQKERYKIERKFGEAKQSHGLGRCRYVGLVRYAIQGFLTAIVLNLKRLVLLLTGVAFKGGARVAA